MKETEIAVLRKFLLDIDCLSKLSKWIGDFNFFEIAKISRMYGFRSCPPLNKRQAYQNNITGISAQDKTSPNYNKQLTFEDICAKREIIKLAEFILKINSASFIISRLKIFVLNERL